MQPFGIWKARYGKRVHLNLSTLLNMYSSLFMGKCVCAGGFVIVCVRRFVQSTKIILVHPKCTIFFGAKQNIFQILQYSLF